MLELIFRPVCLVPLLSFLCYTAYQGLFKKPEPLPKIPILNAKEGEWFSFLRAKWRNTVDFKAALRLAYTQYKDTACIVPLVGSGNTVLLPAVTAQFVAEQPESVLSMHEQTIEGLQTDFTITDPSLVRNPTHHHLISRDLTSQIGNLLPEVGDETCMGFTELWGSDTVEWKELCVYDTMRRILGRITNRAFVGLPLCRDPDLLDAGMAFAQDVPVTANLLRLVPKLIRPVFAPLLTIPNKKHTNAFFKLLVPEVQRRLENFDRKQADPRGESADEGPNDYLQWTVRQAKNSGILQECDPKTIAGRVLLLNMAAIHTSSFSITHAILDLASSKKEYLDELREEVTSVIAAHGGAWTKQALSKMNKLDSVLRESQRLNSFVTIGLQRLVVAKDGFTTPQGLHVPCGATVSVPAYPIMQDSNIYPDAQTFKPFRFSDQRIDASVEHIKKARQAFATTSAEYLAFGHGKNACPGRFFAANELKLMLGHMVQHYDLKLQETRPKNQWYGMNRVPPMKATIKIRRRAND